MRIQYRTPAQLGLLERFHHTLNAEEVYWKLYDSPAQACSSLEVFRQRYTNIRPHWALVPTEDGDPITPTDVFVHGRTVQLPKGQGWAKAGRKRRDDTVGEAHYPIASGDAATNAIT